MAAPVERGTRRGATTGTRTARGLDERYDRLRERFGDTSPKASGYLSEHFFRRERALVLDAVGSESGTVLDLGCGGGLMTSPLAPQVHRVVGLEFNAAACRQAARNGLCAVRGDAFRLPFADAAADLVVNVEFAQQYDAGAAGRLLHEVARVLRPGGRLVIVWSNGRALVRRAASAALYLFNRWRASIAADLVHHAPPRMEAAARCAGLERVEWFAIFPPWRWRLRGVGGPLTGLFGSSFVAVFRKRP